MSRVRFGDVASRLNIKVDQANTDLEYYIGGEHIESSEFMIHDRAPIKGSTIGYQFQFGFRKGDILFMTKNPHLRKTSMVDFDGLCSIATFVIHTNDECVLMQDYLLIEMQTDRFWDYCETHKSGGVNYFINWGTLANYEFDLPSIEEQRQLSEKLWAAYRLKESYRKLLKATDEVVKSRFIEELYTRFPKQKLGEHITVVRGVSYKPSDVRDRDALSPTAIILRSNNIAEGEINFDDLVYVVKERVQKEQELQAGDIVMCGSNGSISLVGKAGLLKTDRPNISFGAFCLGIKCKDTVLPEYLNTYFNTPVYREEIESMGNGTNIINIRPNNITNLMIPIPSLHEQKSFVGFVRQADKSKFELKQAIEKIDKVMRALMQ